MEKIMNFESAFKYKKQIKKLYYSAFPLDERVWLPLLYHKTKNSNYEFFAITDNGNFVGLIYTIKTSKLVYIFFLAVQEEFRGKGYGTNVLQNIIQLNPDRTVILMIEDTSDKTASNYDERINRLNFYQNNGFKQLNISINELGVDFELLGTDTNVEQNDFFCLMRDYLGSKLLYKYFYRKMNI